MLIESMFWAWPGIHSVFCLPNPESRSHLPLLLLWPLYHFFRSFCPGPLYYWGTLPVPPLRGYELALLMGGSPTTPPSCIHGSLIYAIHPCHSELTMSLHLQGHETAYSYIFICTQWFIVCLLFLQGALHGSMGTVSFYHLYRTDP
jgi:hypothetical protein